ncbi:CD209 antigen-like protein C [Urocitellus parryii]|uniref:C-type lectin domain-containing protein n=1 Tax=Urocitellus parryii TaxID=9999 RepID=A0A8D2I6X6_UROPR|nr:CD209 antigen-like protein C [Urocitellus parryii]
MSDFKDVDAQLGSLDEEELITSGAKHSFPHFGFRPPGGLKGLAGFLGHGHIPLVLKLLSLMLLAGILMAVLVKVSKVSHFYEQKRSKQEDIYQELTQAEAEMDCLCRPCPWDWTFFQGHCYFFSKSQRNWNDSVTACQEVGAHLVIIKSAEEQNFLQLTSKNKGSTWMGLSDLNKEGTWLWVDGSPLFFRFMKFWNEGEPNNHGEGEDCAEFRGDGWNDSRCDLEKFWICKKSAGSCSHK